MDLSTTLQFDVPPKADISTAANAVSSYPFFAGREDRSPSVPIWSEVDTRIHILNKGTSKQRALIDSASSAQTHRRPSVHFRNFRSKWSRHSMASQNLACFQTRRVLPRSGLLSICTLVALYSIPDLSPNN